ncbi:MAG TPA: helical backbone metal receptor, partial [Polyangiaceae bacterium LLY-WYZ-15_(1-7)]|nr:helical backbone metal receptor [Polyangiaceae bacterium LLY-WYZ-15_(1-7)]
LVPSETHSVARLAGLDRLVGRTRYCVEPEGIEAVPVIGGTKDVDIEAVRALEPDLILANQEENARKGVQALIDAGLPVHVSFPKTVGDAVSYLVTLAALLGGGVHVVERVRAAYERFARREVEARARVFVPIWNDPWMTFDGNAFASDVLELAGGENVFADRPRRYPLAADLGLRAPLDPARTQGRDTRYPRIRLEEVLARRPDLVLLPDEPHAFDATDAQTLVRAGLPEGRIRFISGKHLFWYGAWLEEGLPALAELLKA